MPVSLNDLTNIKCEKCEGIYFQPVLAFKNVSRLITGAANDGVHPYEAMLCAKCGEPLPINLSPEPQQQQGTILKP